jgi:hypothetical protein
MKTQRQALFHAILARLSFGAVPIDGAYWFDPKHVGATRPDEQVKAPEADWSPVSLSLSGRRSRK